MKRACVIGWPIDHSRSPLIHGYWLKNLGIQGAYERRAVVPADLPAFINGLPESDYTGCNVTLPHKEKVFDLVIPADQATRTLGAVNTVFLRDGKAWGTNTDGEGFLANLESHVRRWNPGGKSVVILGAGGSARAIIAALSAAGASIIIVNRTAERAEAIRKDFGSGINVSPWDGLGPALRDADLLINSTSLGMTGQPPLDLDLTGLPQTALVADLIYVPLETELVKAARARGHRVIPGLGMLLHQAVRGFELWFGARPEVTAELYDIVAADIQAGPQQ